MKNILEEFKTTFRSWYFVTVYNLLTHDLYLKLKRL